MDNAHVRFVRRPQAQALFGGLGRSAWYKWMSDGLMVPPVRVGGKLRCYPAHELDAIAAAWLAGATEPEIKALVARLLAQRSAGKEGAAR